MFDWLKQHLGEFCWFQDYCISQCLPERRSSIQDVSLEDGEDDSRMVLGSYLHSLFAGELPGQF